MKLETVSSKPLNNDFKMTREEFMMLVGTLLATLGDCMCPSMFIETCTLVLVIMIINVVQSRR